MNNLNRLLILLLIFGFAGCGIKVWPEPDASHEKFSISVPHHRMPDDCLEIHVEISGNYRNLGRVILELEVSEEPCPTCPFLVTDSIYLEPGSPELTLVENRLIIVRCGLDPDKYYRARIIAGNVYPIIRDVKSGVVIISR